MSRPWFKVAAKIKDDPAMIRLSPPSFKVFLFIMAQACEEDNDGAVCQSEDLAMLLRTPSKVIAAALKELDGRVFVDDDGTVRVRDWLQWQSPSRKPEPSDRVAERQRKSRASRSRHATVTLRDGNRDVDASRSGHASLELEVEKEREQEQPPIPHRDQPAAPVSSGVATATPAPSESFTSQVTPAISQSLSGARLTGKGGKLMRWVVDVLDVLNSHSAHDAGIAVATWLAFADSDSWRFKGAAPERWPAALGDWLANGHKVHPSRNGNHNPAIKADDDRTETPMSPETIAMLAEAKVKYANVLGPSVAAGGAT